MAESEDSEIQSSIDKFANDFSSIEISNPPSTLFHYTSNDTLLNIVRSRSLWLTHALFLNDSTEFQHGMRKFMSGIDHFEKHGFDKGWLDHIRNFFSKELNDPLAQPFVFSLSQERDQLSQWRGYGDFGHGVSIGFSANEISEISQFHLKILPVIYDHAKQNEIVNRTVEGFKSLFQKLGHKIDNGVKWGPWLALAYFQIAYVHSIRFKDPSWHEEKEWRAVAIADGKNKNVFTRTRGKSLVKSLTLPLENLEKLIAEVVIGPQADKVRHTLALESVKTSTGCRFEIGRSSIPMRD